MNNSTNQQIREYVKKGFMGLTIGLNALLTFMFGATYGSNTFPTPLPALSFILGGLFLTLVYDLASIAWFYTRTGDNQSRQQRAIATILSAAAMLASVLVSAIQIGLTTNLIDLAPYYASIGLFGIVMQVLLVSAHFIGIFAYQFASPEYRKLDAVAEETAFIQDFQISERQRVQTKVIEGVRARMNGRIHEIADGQADLLFNELVANLSAPENQTLLPAAGQTTAIIHEDGKTTEREVFIYPPANGEEVANGTAKTTKVYYWVLGKDNKWILLRDETLPLHLFVKMSKSFARGASMSHAQVVAITDIDTPPTAEMAGSFFYFRDGEQVKWEDFMPHVEDVINVGKVSSEEYKPMIHLNGNGSGK